MRIRMMKRCIGVFVSFCMVFGLFGPVEVAGLAGGRVIDFEDAVAGEVGPMYVSQGIGFEAVAPEGHGDPITIFDSQSEVYGKYLSFYNYNGQDVTQSSHMENHFYSVDGTPFTLNGFDYFYYMNERVMIEGYNQGNLIYQELINPWLNSVSPGVRNEVFSNDKVVVGRLYFDAWVVDEVVVKVDPAIGGVIDMDMDNLMVDYTPVDLRLATFMVPGMQDVTDVTDHSAVVNVTIEDIGGPGEVLYGMCWDMDGTPSLEDECEMIGRSGVGLSYSRSFESLLPETTYYVRGYAINGAGIVYSEVIQFTTAETVAGEVFTSPGIATFEDEVLNVPRGAEYDTEGFVFEVEGDLNTNITVYDVAQFGGNMLTFYDVMSPEHVHSRNSFRSNTGEAFLLNSLDLYTYQSHMIEITGLRNDVVVESAVVSTLDSQVLDNEGVVFTKSDALLEGIGGGTLTFSGWDGIDEIVFKAADDGGLDIDLDNIKHGYEDNPVQQGGVFIDFDDMDSVSYGPFLIKDGVVFESSDPVGEDMVVYTLGLYGFDNLLSFYDYDLTGTSSHKSNIIRKADSSSFIMNGFDYIDYSRVPVVFQGYKDGLLVKETGLLDLSVSGISEGVQVVCLENQGTVYGRVYFDGWVDVDEVRFSIDPSSEKFLDVDIDNVAVGYEENELEDVALTSIDVTNVETYSAVAHIGVNDAGSPGGVFYGVCWNTVGQPTLEDDLKIDGYSDFGSPYAEVIEQLSPNTTYYVRGFALNAAGVTYSEQMEFTTDELVMEFVSPDVVTFEDEVAGVARGPLYGIDGFVFEVEGSSNLSVMVFEAGSKMVTFSDYRINDIEHSRNSFRTFSGEAFLLNSFELYSFKSSNLRITGRRQGVVVHSVDLDTLVCKEYPDGVVYEKSVGGLMGLLTFSGWNDIDEIVIEATDDAGLDILLDNIVHGYTDDVSQVPEVQTGAVLDVGLNYGTVSMSLDSMGIPEVVGSQVGVCASKVGEPTVADIVYAVGGEPVVGELQVLMDNLEAGTTYYVRAFARNVKGVVYGDVVEFTTHALSPMPVAERVITFEEAEAGSVGESGPVDSWVYDGFKFTVTGESDKDITVLDASGEVVLDPMFGRILLFADENVDGDETFDMYGFERADGGEFDLIGFDVFDVLGSENSGYGIRGLLNGAEVMSGEFYPNAGLGDVDNGISVSVDNGGCIRLVFDGWDGLDRFEIVPLGDTMWLAFDHFAYDEVGGGNSDPDPDPDPSPSPSPSPVSDSTNDDEEELDDEAIAEGLEVMSVANHWSKVAVNGLAGRGVLFNVDTFIPDEDITRGDFAEYVVRALGFYDEEAEPDNPFSDVTSENERMLGILIANDIGVVTGYPDGTFRSEQLISREEAMVMAARAMKLVELAGEDVDRFENYDDFLTVSEWAKESVREVLAAHVFNGVSETMINPKGQFSYSQAAQSIWNMLMEIEE